MKTDGLSSLLSQQQSRSYLVDGVLLSGTAFRGDQGFKDQLVEIAKECVSVQEFAEHFNCPSPGAGDEDELGKKTGLSGMFWRTACFLEGERDGFFVRDMIEAVPVLADLSCKSRPNWATRLGAFCCEELAKVPDRSWDDELAEVVERGLMAGSRILDGTSDAAYLSVVEVARQRCEAEAAEANQQGDSFAAESFENLEALFEDCVNETSGMKEQVPMDAVAAAGTFSNDMRPYERKTTEKFLSILASLPSSKP